MEQGEKQKNKVMWQLEEVRVKRHKNQFYSET